MMSAGKLSFYLTSIWWMEVFVLLLIAYEVGSKLLRKRKVQRRRAELFKLIAKGQDLKRTVSSPQNTLGVKAWYERVQAWAEEAKTLLKSYSPQAVTAFLQSGTRYFPYANVADGAHSRYNELLSNIDNLIGIMEKPDAYY